MVDLSQSSHGEETPPHSSRTVFIPVKSRLICPDSASGGFLAIPSDIGVAAQRSPVVFRLNQRFGPVHQAELLSELSAFEISAKLDIASDEISPSRRTILAVSTLLADERCRTNSPLLLSQNIDIVS
jgi:hypothetical protein